MNLDQLHELVYRQRGDAIHRYHNDDGLLLFLNYVTFGHLRDQLRAHYLFDPHPTGNHHTFKCMGVTVSWSPAIEQPDGYAFGRAALT